MKAIHNSDGEIAYSSFVGNYMLKYNFESNSQRIAPYRVSSVGWELYAKVQFWKQFTTIAGNFVTNTGLGIIC